MDDKPKAKSVWEVDTRVNITLVLAIVAQTGGAFWWASAVSNRLDSQERRITLSEVSATDLQRTNVEFVKTLGDLRTENIRALTELRVTLATLTAELNALRQQPRLVPVLPQAPATTP